MQTSAAPVRRSDSGHKSRFVPSSLPSGQGAGACQQQLGQHRHGPASSAFFLAGLPGRARNIEMGPNAYQSEDAGSGTALNSLGQVVFAPSGVGDLDVFIESEADYFKKQENIKNEIFEFVNERYVLEKLTIDINALDVRGRAIDGLYLTVTGTSAEAGDSGQVGRGNNVAGVIPLNRPMSSEAAAGKNPVSHVGKIYNALCYRIANRVMMDVSGVKEVYVWLLSQIGKPINEPSVVSAQIIPENDVSLISVTKLINEVISDEFDHLQEFCRDLAEGKITLC